MFSDFNNQSYLLNREFKTSPQIINTQFTYEEKAKEKKIRHIEGILRIGDLSKAFNTTVEIPDVELLLVFFREKYDFSLGEENPFNFMIDVIGFSLETLKLVGADKNEYYIHRSVSDCLETILNELLDKIELMDTKNGYPSFLNIQNNQINTLISFNKFIFLPLSDNNLNAQYNQVLHIIKQFGFRGDPTDLYFHGTDFMSAGSIMQWIQIFPRITDFGERNFYVSDSFRSTCQWVQHKQQKAIVVFHIPKNILDSLYKLKFTMENIEEWKFFFNKIRNPPKISKTVFLDDKLLIWRTKYIISK